ncbi:aminotransferase class I/II-fold pyridoxal phosphate-dependent enzyme [Brachybacterium phenoliresistens]|uniref:Aminotransferase n=1 Tax=Brachybacterium phenoliresistens TaxID=396014 RepID=Z9JZ20_9MICO|nr:aminotransferase class I/II-fold pyridoxal phosphate-dependent enzyme [Brachybacterium phenoliresistens]EWS83051.1 aminotransferase [Brachybacterium phenoliresistens]
MNDAPDAPWRRAAAAAGLLGPDGAPAPTIFAEMTALARRTGALNLGQGFPDEPGPPEVTEAAIRAIRDGVNQYSPGRGEPDLIAAIAEHQRRFHGISLEDPQILVTAGATEALAATLLSQLNPGDEIVVLEPYYDAYVALAALAGAQIVPVELHGPDYRLDLERLRTAVTDRTAVILVNSPHNPTGAVLAPEALDAIIALAHRHDALIVTDEVYEHLTYEAPHVPIAARPGGFERTLSISSAGKVFSVTGWKIGWVSGPAALIEQVMAIKQYLTFVSGAPFQPAVAVGLRLPDAFFEGLRTRYRAKRDLLVGALTEAGFAVSPPAAGYFALADAAPLGLADARTAVRELPGMAGVVAVPLGAFARPEREDLRSIVRFAFCKSDALLEDAAGRLRDLGAQRGSTR